MIDIIFGSGVYNLSGARIEQQEVLIDAEAT